MDVSVTERSHIRIAEEIELDAWEAMVHAAPPPFAQAVGLAATKAHGALLLEARRIPSSMFNRVLGLGIERPATRDDIDRIVLHYERAGIPSFWVHAGCASSPGDLPSMLEERGFVKPARLTWAKMLRGPERMPMPSSELSLRTITAEEAPAFAHVISTAHGMPSAMNPWIERLTQTPGWVAFAAFERRTLVSGGMLFQKGDRAWLGLGGTLPEHRGKGGQGLTMAARIAHASERGAQHIETETGEAIAGEANISLANMYRFGFRKVCSRQNFEYRTA